MNYDELLPSPEEIILKKIRTNSRWSLIILYLIKNLEENKFPITLKKAESDLLIPKALLFQYFSFLESLKLLYNIKVSGINKYVTTQEFKEIKDLLKKECEVQYARNNSKNT
ncbi:MAG: hypothetical protein QXU20_03845 [Candidatus Woesearchaeota archaeon]